jgi:hypothetical protein
MSEIVHDSKLGNMELSNNLGLTLSSESPRIKHIGTGALTVSSQIGDVVINANGNVSINSNNTTTGILIGSRANIPVTIGSGGGEITLGADSSNATFAGNVTISGDLTVVGETVSQEVTVIQSEDPMLYLNQALTNADTNTSDIGFVGNRGNTSNIGFFWDESADQFVCALFTDDGDLTTTTVSPIDDYANLRCGALAVDDQLNVSGSSVNFLADSVVTKFGADGDVTLTHVADTGLRMNSNMQMQFRDSAIHIESGTDGHLNIQADQGVNININGTSRLATTASTTTFGTNIVIPDAGSIGSATDTDAITISSGGVVAVTAGTASTSATTGALTVNGGMGVSTDLYVGDDISLISDGALLSFGADSEVSLLHIHNVGLRFAATNQLQFRDNEINISSPTDGNLFVHADSSVSINIGGTTATKFTINESTTTFGTNIVIPNAGSIGSASDTDAITIGSNGAVVVTSTTPSTNNTTGALSVRGGASVLDDLYVGGDVNLATDTGILTFGAASDITLTTIGGIGLQLNTNKKIMMRDENIHISSVTDGYMNLQADLGVHINVGGTVELAVTSSTATFGTNIVIPNAGSIGSASDTDAITISSAGVVAVTNGTASTSETTGALTVTGGAGISGGLHVGEDISMSSNGRILSFGVGNDVSLSHVASTGLLLNSDRQIQFNNSDAHISSLMNGVLNVQGNSGVHINVNGTVELAVTSSTATFGTNIVIPNAGSIGSTSDTDAITISSAGVVAVTSSTASTSATTGALTVTGGAGISADLYVGDDVNLISDGAILAFGADSEVSLTHVADTGLLLNGTNNIQFGDSEVNISSMLDGYLDLSADIAVQIRVDGTVPLGITSTTSTFGTNIIIPDDGSIGRVGDTDAITFGSDGIVAITALTSSTSTITGALTVAGGLGVVENVFVGGDINLASDNAILAFGETSDITLTTIGGIGLQLNNNKKIMMRDENIHISSVTDGYMNLQADLGVNINIGGTVELAVTSSTATFGTSLIVNSYTPVSPAAGMTGAVTTRVSEINGEVVTTILVDLDAIDVIASGDADDIIGLTGGISYITQITSAVNGVIYYFEMTCVEVPTVGDDDINLVSSATATNTQGNPVTSPTVLVNGGQWSAIGQRSTQTITITPNHYLYLTQGGTTSGTYTAGKYLIKLYGTKF